MTCCSPLEPRDQFVVEISELMLAIAFSDRIARNDSIQCRREQAGRVWFTRGPAPLPRCRLREIALRPAPDPRPHAIGGTCHGTQQDRADRRRPDRRHAGPVRRAQGTGRCRAVRRRRGRAAGQGARHRAGLLDRGLRRGDHRRQRLQRDQGRRRGDRHGRRAAQAGHEPRRSDRHQHEDRRRGRRRHQGERARRASSSRSPTRSTRWSGS